MAGYVWDLNKPLYKNIQELSSNLAFLQITSLAMMGYNAER